jgi:hypothetical protein
MQTSVEIKTRKNAKIISTSLSKDVNNKKEMVSPAIKKLKPKGKTQFQKDCEGAITIEEARKRSLAFIDRIWKK